MTSRTSHTFGTLVLDASSDTNAKTNKESLDQMWIHLTGFMRTQVIAAAAALSLADHLEKGPLTAEEFAAKSGLHASVAFRFLRACAGIGLVTREAGRTFRSKPLLKTLLSGTPGSLRELAMNFAGEGHYLPWGRLLEGLRTEEQQATAALGMGIFEHFVLHPEEAANFWAAMQAVTSDLTAEIGKRLDTASSSLAVDVGGATGNLLYGIMLANPKLHGIVFDRPDVVVHAAAAAETLKLTERSQTIGGSFLEFVPEGDLHLLRFILHDWNDDIAIRILNNCRRAMRPNGRLVIVEAFLGEPGERPASSMVDTQAALIDLHMLLMGNGRERSIAEYDALIQAAGLHRTKITPLSSGYVIIEAGVA